MKFPFDASKAEAYLARFAVVGFGPPPPDDEICAWLRRGRLHRSRGWISPELVFERDYELIAERFREQAREQRYRHALELADVRERQERRR